MIKKIVSKLFYGYRSDSDTYLNYLRSKGAKIGTDVTLFDVSLNIGQ